MRIYHVEHNAYSQIELVQWAQDLMKEGAPWEIEIAQFVIDWFNDSEFIETFTSGSTGSPKLIKLRKEAMEASANLTNTFFSLDYNKTALLCLPAKYIGGKMMIVRSLISGMNLLLRSPSSRPLKDIEDSSVDFCAMVPVQVETSLQNDFSVFKKIENIIIGGGPISNVLEKKLAVTNQQLYGTFGMTETVSHVALRELTTSKESAIFKALPGITFSLNTSPGLENCLVIDAPHLSSDPIETRDVVDLISGTEFAWLGRIDMVINSGGIKISPEKLEKDMAAILPSSKYFIASLPDQKLGEKVILIIEGESSDPKVISALLEKLKTALPPYHAPKEIFFVKAFVRTENGKLQRNATQELIA